MADEAPRKRSFRKYSYRGVDLEQLLDMSTDELVELFAARQRRRYVQQPSFNFIISHGWWLPTEIKALSPALIKLQYNPSHHVYSPSTPLLIRLQIPAWT